MKPSRLIWPVLLLAIAAIAYYFFVDPDTSVQGDILVQVENTPLIVNIHASGELQAKKSEKIKGPDGLRSVGIYQVTIQDLVTEGTVVEKGEYIATLDKTELDGKITESQSEIDKIITQLDQAKIDTAIEMRGLRDQLINLQFSMKDKELTRELSKYEPKAIQQQAQLDLEKSQRDYDQLENRLSLTRTKSIAQIEEINTSYRQQEFKLNRLVGYQQRMTILAPKPGMVIYARDWNGKRGPGSQISAWSPVVAELPDLSEMITMVYINEVDISKVLPGQNARISADAFPGKEFKGRVISKANIGEQVRNFDTKVFEVVVFLEEQDSLLRPAMTTGISIMVDSIDNCLQVPLEAIQSDSLSFVFKKLKGRFVKQEVVTGPSNSMNIMVALGLEESDDVSLNPPANPEELEFVFLDVEAKNNAIKKLEDDLNSRLKIQREKAAKIKKEDFESQNEGGQTMIIF